jgi:hypothetical protein
VTTGDDKGHKTGRKGQSGKDDGKPHFRTSGQAPPQRNRIAVDVKHRGNGGLVCPLPEHDKKSPQIKSAETRPSYVCRVAMTMAVV